MSKIDLRECDVCGQVWFADEEHYWFPFSKSYVNNNMKYCLTRIYRSLESTSLYKIQEKISAVYY